MLTFLEENKSNRLCLTRTNTRESGDDFEKYSSMKTRIANFPLSFHQPTRACVECPLCAPPPMIPAAAIAAAAAIVSGSTGGEAGGEAGWKWAGCGGDDSDDDDSDDDDGDEEEMEEEDDEDGDDENGGE